MTRQLSTTLASAGAALALLLSSSCVTQQEYQKATDELALLRSERAELRKENQGLRQRLDMKDVQLSEANSQLSIAPDVSYPELDSLGVTYGERAGNMVITLPNDITFASGRADLTTSGKQALQAVATALKNDYAGSRYWIEGHTDSDPIKKSKFGSNRELSFARAMSVLHHLVDECDIGDAECVVAGHGEYRPIADNSSKAGKAQNRRVEIIMNRVE